MLLTFLDKLGGFFDSRFVIAYWMPCFIFAALVVAEEGLLYNYEAALKWWDALPASTATLLGASLLFCITIFAYLLQPFSVALTRLYLGYWPGGEKFFLARWGRARERAAWTAPEVSEERLLPTRLGNTLAASYDYGFQVYNIDPAVWLPRLAPLLPQAFRAQMDGALTPLLSLLNLCTLLLLFAAAGALRIAVHGRGWPLFLSVWLGGLLLAACCYRAAVRQAEAYALHIRTAFDLYRHELFKQMRLPLPDTPEKEGQVWGRLTRWVLFKDAPPEFPWDGTSPDVELTYDNYAPSPSDDEGYSVTLPGSPPLTLTLKK